MDVVESEKWSRTLHILDHLSLFGTLKENTQVSISAPIPGVSGGTGDSSDSGDDSAAAGSGDDSAGTSDDSESTDDDSEGTGEASVTRTLR